MSNKLKTIPLCQLRPSKINIRKTDRLADIEQLAASIQANGLLENLVVQSADTSSNDGPLFEVVAGGRRLAALKLLVKRKKLDRDHRVPCLVIENGAAVEASLAENFVRAPVHPADQCDAFAALNRQGLSADDIAARFGITPSFVLQRLKLSSVSPRLIAEYRQGAMTLEQLTAFTLSDDHKTQEEVWFERAHGDMPAHIIRRVLTRTQVESNDRRARFIGAKAYEGAGGAILRDLFDTEDEGYFSDSQLLDRLVAEKLETIAETVRTEGWRAVEVYADADLLHLGRFGRVKMVEQQLSEPEEERLSALGERYDELVAALDEDDSDEIAAELDKVGADITLLQQKKETWPDEEKVRAVSVVTLGPDGHAQILRGLLKPDEHDAAVGELPTPKKRTRTNGYADSVLMDLSAHRTAALRELLAQQPETALLALLHALVDRLFYAGPAQNCLGVVAQETRLDRASQSVNDGKAAQAFGARHAAWTERLPEKDDCWEWLGQLSSDDRLALLAHCVGMTVNVLERQAKPESVSALTAALRLDMGAWWRPTRENFLDRLTKDEILSAVSEGVSQQAAWRLAGLKKERIVKEAEKLLGDSGWLPGPLRAATLVVEAVAAQ
jgi:ParB family transcriptional regulator, chromosome partitioning protein